MMDNKEKIIKGEGWRGRESNNGMEGKIGKDNDKKRKKNVEQVREGG